MGPRRQVPRLTGVTSHFPTETLLQGRLRAAVGTVCKFADRAREPDAMHVVISAGTHGHSFGAHMLSRWGRPLRSELSHLRTVPVRVLANYRLLLKMKAFIAG